MTPDEQSLDPRDPTDWEAVRQTFHTAVDCCLDHLQTLHEQPVWQATPASVKESFHEALPEHGQSLDSLLSVFEETILPYGAGNTHPRFWGWVHGSGTVAGAMAEMLAGFLNCNTGGRDQIGLYVEQQVIRWCQDIFGFPHTASGILTTGTSLGTLIALTVARDVHGDGNIQQHGVGTGKKLIGYTSAEAHSCIAKTSDLLGLGREALRLVPVDADHRLQTGQLARMIEADRAAGFLPFAVIASAGTVNTGAIDDLEAISAICRDKKLWMHVDAAFGGLAILTPEFQSQLAPIAQSDSVAFDFHKWLHVPYDTGGVLIQDAVAHRQAFAMRREYLTSASAGLAGGDLWYCDYGPELSRGFRALKVWFTLKTYGVKRLAEMIAKNCEQAAFLAELITAHPALEILSPVSLNIVCFRFIGTSGEGSAADWDEINQQIVITLQIQGIAAPSTTRVHGQLAIRVCLTNHRTRQEDLSLLVQEVLRIGQALS